MGAPPGVGLASGETGALVGVAGGEMGAALGVAEGAAGTMVALGATAGVAGSAPGVGVGLPPPRRPHAATSSTTRTYITQPNCLFIIVSWVTRDPKDLEILGVYWEGGDIIYSIA
jgi:hypothetical protein